MIHNDIQNQLQLLIKTSAPPLIDVAESPVAAPQWQPGQRLPAFVMASLPNGRFQVQVQDQMLDLNLPSGTQPGDALELTYVGNSPRMTFALTQELARSLPANSGVSLSDAAKFLGGLLQKTANEAVTAAPLTRAAPILPGAPADIPDFAQALRSAVSQSGLFYESHQVQWLSGQRSLASLLQEPQGKLSPLLTQGQASATGTQSLLQSGQPTPAGTALPGASPMLNRETDLQAAQLVSRLSSPVALEAQRPDIQPLRTSDAGPLPANPQALERALAEPVHPQATQLVNQQLQALDSRQILWQGQVWPGQEMYWEIEEDGHHRGQSGEEEAASWHTRLNLQLPVLGGVSAKLALVEGALRLDIATDNTNTAELMRGHQELLGQRLQEAGLKLTGISVRQADEAVDG